MDEKILETVMLFGGQTVLDKIIMEERERTIMNFHQGMGLSAQDIANVQHWHVQYVQSVIDKFEKKA